MHAVNLPTEANTQRVCRWHTTPHATPISFHRPGYAGQPTPGFSSGFCCADAQHCPGRGINYLVDGFTINNTSGGYDDLTGLASQHIPDRAQSVTCIGTLSQKLVDKIQSGQFVEIRELLTDSISLIQQSEAFGTHTSLPTLPGVVQPSLRESCSQVSGRYPLWMYCFLAYTAIRAPDQDIRDRLLACLFGRPRSMAAQAS